MKQMTPTQRNALKKLWNAERGSITLYYSDQPTAATKMALNKLGLLDGRIEPKTWRGPARIYDTKLSAAGIALAEQLFGMDWWAELMGAFISTEMATAQRLARIAKAQSIAETLNLETAMNLSGDAERGYSAEYKDELVEIRIYKTYFELRQNEYVLQPKIRAYQMTAGQARFVAERLTDAANVLHVFKGAQ